MAKNKGFTLVEVLMVVLIIAALSGILISTFNTQVQQSKVSTLKANLENIRMALELYYSQERMMPNPNLDPLYNGASPSGTVYISEIPEETLTGSTIVTQVLNGSGGWYVDTTVSTDFQVYPNLSGTDIFGEYYSNY